MICKGRIYTCKIVLVCIFVVLLCRVFCTSPPFLILDYHVGSWSATLGVGLPPWQQAAIREKEEAVVAEAAAVAAAAAAAVVAAAAAAAAAKRKEEEAVAAEAAAVVVAAAAAAAAAAAVTAAEAAAAEAAATAAAAARAAWHRALPLIRAQKKARIAALEAKKDEQKILQDPSLEALRDEPMALAGEPLLCVEDDYNSESDDDSDCGGGETKGSGMGGAALLRPSPRLGQITPGVLAQFPVRLATPITTARALRCKINQAGSGGSRGGEGDECRGEPSRGINGVILPNASDPAIAAIRLKVHTADPFDPASYGDQVIRVKGIGRVIAEIVPEDRIRPGRKYDVRDATSDNGVATCAVTINGKSVSVQGSCFVMPTVPEGPVEINISAPGFADKRERRFNYAGLHNSLETDKLFLNPIMQQGEIRVTLKWADQPKDLDLHCTTDKGDHVYVYEYV